MSKKAEPLYKKIARDISIDIGKGIYKSTTPLKFQSEYAREYQTSTGTVKKAFSLLKRNGLICPVKGHGTYVNAFETDPNNDSGSYRLGFISSKQSPATKVLSQGIIYTNKTISAALEVELFSPCYRLQLLRLINNHPITLQNIYIRYDKLSQCNFYQYDLSKISLFSLYSQYLGSNDFVSEKSLHAIICPSYIRSLLSIESDLPILFIKSVLKHGTDIIEYNESYERTDLKPHTYKKHLHPKK